MKRAFPNDILENDYLHKPISSEDYMCVLAIMENYFTA